MRFQQLNRDPNTVMRKKLVKSKKNWVVVSSLSIAGGLFLLGAPSYVANAATTTDVVQQQTVVTPTSSDSGTTSAPVTDGSTNTSSPDNGATGSTTDDSKETVKSGSENTNTPINGTGDKSTTPDSTTNGGDTGNNGTETTNGDENTQGQPQAQAFSAEAAPVVEDTSVTTNSGNGWSYDTDTTTLTITGKLDEGNGSYQEDRWGGNTADITTIKTVEGAFAPVDSSYLFANMTKLKSDGSDFSHLNTSNTTNAQGMFTNDINLTTPDFSNNDFSKMENISHMFENDHGLLTIQLGGMPFKSIVNGSYAFADCEKLTDFIGQFSPDYSSTNAWYARSVANLISMFKNDKSLQVIQLTTWGWLDGTETGDSSIGEGMFDGTNLASIKISAALKFNPKTALTSNKGIKWTDTTFGQTFSGVPTFDDNGNPTGGLGSVYTGKDTTQLQGKDDLKNKFLVWNASGVPDSTTQVSNLVTIHTTHDGITSDITTTANGTWNSTVNVKVPSSYSFDPNKSPYVTSVQTVPVVLGFTEATAADTVPYTPAVAKSGNVSVKASNGTSIDIPVTAADTDTIGDTKTVTVTNDQIEKLVPGYHLANDAESTDVEVKFISPTTDNPDITGTSTSTIDLVGDTTPENDKGSVYTQQGANEVSVPITIPAGTVGTPSDPIKIAVDGYVPTTVTATTNVVDGKNVTTYTDKDGNVIDNEHPLVLEGNPVDENTGSINTTQGTNKDVAVPVNVPAGTIGTPSDPIDINVDGYKPTTVTATTNVVDGKNVTTYTDKDGNIIDNEHPLVLEGNPVSENTGSINTTQGTNKNVAVPVNVPAGTIGTPVGVTVSAPGYKSEDIFATTNVVDGQNVVTYTDKDGNIIDNEHPLVLEGNPVSENIGSINTTQGTNKNVAVPVNVPAGTIGTPSDPIDINVDGYKPTTVTATTNVVDGKNVTTYTDKDGNVIDNDHPLVLEGNPVDAITDGSVFTNQGNNKDVPVTVTVSAGTIGTPVGVTVSAPGYKSEDIFATTNVVDGQNVVTYTDKNGNVIDKDNPLTLTGNPVDENSGSINTTQGYNKNVAVPVTVPAGTIGTPSDPIDINVDGYQPTTVTATTNVVDGKNVTTYTDKDGNVIDSDHPLVLVGNPVSENSGSINTTQGTNKNVAVPVTVPAGTIGTPSDPININVDGYQPTTVTATTNVVDGKNVTTYTDKDGNVIDNDHPLVLEGNPVASQKISIPAMAGQKDNTQEVTIKGGKVGDTEDITLIGEPGYTAPTVTVTYGPNKPFTVVDKTTGKPITKDTPAKYIGTPNKATTITFTKPDGTTQVIDIPAGIGNYGDAPITYTADSVNGYTSPSVIVTYTIGGVPTISYASDPNKTVLPTDKLTYTPIPTSSGNTDNQENGDIEYKNQTISTYADKPAVELYQLGQDGKMTLVTNRSLATATDWQSDAVITIDGVGYYRVSTNEWAKMSQAYPYTAPNVYVRAYSDSAKSLYKAESDLIENRSLAANSSWIADHQTYVINGTKHYRVSTNEFVDEKDVYEYTPVDEIVTTHSGSYVSLYTAKGDLVSNRSLSANSSWKTDSITTINGEQYYRVSTNEFVKASDVDVNH